MAQCSSVPRRISPDAARRAFNLRFIGEAFTELRRVTWPTRRETMRLTWMVISVAVTIGIFLGFVDLGFSRLLDVILGS